MNKMNEGIMPSFIDDVIQTKNEKRAHLFYPHPPVCVLERAGGKIITKDISKNLISHEKFLLPPTTSQSR